MKLSQQYLAGILDGEGYLGIMRRADKHSKYGYYYFPVIKILMTGKGIEIIEEMCKIFGGNVYTRKPYQGKSCICKTAVCWSLRDMKMISSFLKKLGKYLFIKKEQADIILELIGGKLNNNVFNGTFNYQPEMERRKELYQKIRQLNTRGEIVLDLQRLSERTPKGDAIVRPVAII
jgi:hypothetical protein